MGPDQSAVDAVQQRQEAVAYRYRAGQDALRSQPAASQRRQAQGNIRQLQQLIFQHNGEGYYFISLNCIVVSFITGKIPSMSSLVEHCVSTGQRLYEVTLEWGDVAGRFVQGFEYLTAAALRLL